MKILITGASSGLGEEIAIQYATPTNELILLARRKERLLALQERLRPHAKSVEVVVADVGDFAHLKETIATIGAVDMVILNAGVSLGHAHTFTPLEDFRDLLDVNLVANHAILEPLLPYFKARGGKIVFISSLASLYTMPTSLAYSTSKAALNAYAQGIANSYEQYGVKVITILPGFIKSEMTDKNSFHMPFFLSTQEGVRRIKKAIEKNKRLYAFPKRFYFLILFFRKLPHFLQQKIITKLL